MTPARHASILALAALALTSCGRADDRADVRTLAEGFYADVAHQDGVHACGLLSSETRQALVQQESEPCAKAVVGLKLTGRLAQTVRLYTTQASVALRGGDTVYLESTPDGWRVSAAGCRGPAYAQPADCEVES
jgi:hypothetical protein